MSPLFTVPETELTPEYIPLPTGHYDADFNGVEIVGNDNGWRALAVSFENLATATGETEIQTTHKGREMTLQLAQRRKTARFTVEANNPQAVEIGGRDIVKLADALGVAVRDDAGNVAAPGDTVEELADALNGARGTRVRIAIKQQPRKRNKIVQTDDAGNPIMDDEVKRVWRPEGA